jgi:hypothetical protein
VVSAKVTGPIHPAKPLPVLLKLIISAALTLVSFALFTDALLTNPHQYQYKQVDFVAFSKRTRDNLTSTRPKVVP